MNKVDIIKIRFINLGARIKAPSFTILNGKYKRYDTEFSFYIFKFNFLKTFKDSRK